MPRVKRIGFLSFGHWSDSPYSQVRSASDALLPVDRAGGGRRGARRRRRLLPRPPLRPPAGSPFPLLAAVGARTSRIEIGTAVIDMRYENPFYMAEDAGAADSSPAAGSSSASAAARRSRSSTAAATSATRPREGETDADMARRHAEVFLEVPEGRGLRRAEPAADVPQPARPPAPRAALRRACATASGGAPRRPRPPSGRPSWA